MSVWFWLGLAWVAFGVATAVGWARMRARHKAEQRQQRYLRLEDW